MSQDRAGRRGAVFSIRVTDEERAELERLQGASGPRALGPWLVWRALRGRGPGNTGAGASTLPLEGVLPELHVRRGTTPPGARSGSTPTSDRVILDLCGGSGAWSLPYAGAGYPVTIVTLPHADVREFVPPPGVWGVLAAPPCDQFSLARNGHPELARDFARGLEAVVACLRVIALARPVWWALENPVGMLSRWLGTPRDVWQPCDFGDAWTKRTAIWGSYVIPERGPFVEPRDGGGPLCEDCNGGMRTCSNAAHRAVTPSGFARAFFEANP